jgi:hypothetical protein
VIGRIWLPVSAAAVQLAASLLVLGPPDPGLASGFLVSSLPTVAETLAALELLVWAMVSATVAWGLASMLRAGAPAARAVRRRFWEVSVAGAGLVLLGIGVAHHSAYQVTLSGGSVQEAQQAVGR